MSDTVYIVVIDNGDTEPELMVFDDEQLAEQWAGVRGGCVGIQSHGIIGEHDAKKLIEAEAKERRDEERFDRMRQGDNW